MKLSFHQRDISKQLSKSTLILSRIGLYFIVLLSCASCQSSGAWLTMCAEIPLTELNNRDESYLAHILNTEEKATVLQVSAIRPDKPGCEAREMSVSSEEVIWAGFVKPAIANEKQVALQGRELNDHFVVSEIITPDEPVEAPATVAIKPRPVNKEALFPQVRASWFWSPATWLNNPQHIFDTQVSLSLKRIYITVPVKEGRVQHPEQLHQFLQSAHQRDLQVWGVIGDPNVVLERERLHFSEIAGAYEAFNINSPEQKLDGLQLDIEPYLMPGYQLNPAVWLQKQAQAVNAVHQSAPSLRLDMVLPFWFDPLQGNGAMLLADVETSIGSITVMNYRTDPEQISHFAEKFLEWGERSKKAVYIALESLEMQEEERRVYRQAESGELWHFDFKQGPILLLLKQQAQDLPGDKSFRFLYKRKIDGSGTSFFQQPGELTKLLPILEKQFSAWSSFAGMALHGFEKP